MAKKIIEFIQGIIVELFDLVITDRKDDRFGRVVTTSSVTEDDLIRSAAAKHTDVTPTTMKAAFDLLNHEFVEALLSGASIRYGYFHVHLKTNGVFIGDHATWDPKIHSLQVQTTPTAELREIVHQAKVTVRGMAQSAIFINSLTDVTSGEKNSLLTPGGGVHVAGNRIKIVGTEAGIGIHLVNINTEETFTIAAPSILTNEPSKLTFIVPVDLPAGDYHLTVTTQFSAASEPLKEPRTATLDYVLLVAVNPS
jgi:hypothetical protein